MSFLNKLLGSQLASSASKKQELTVLTGVPALGLDALASIGYGPEAALIVLLPLGALGLHYFFIVSMMVIGQLFLLYLSYQQTAAAYPMGGGAYTVASANLGKKAGLCAAASLLIDYLLNVAVGISAGVGVIVSAIPFLQPYTLTLCLIVLLTLAVVNLRGVRESGLMFIYPAVAFILFLGISVLIGLYKTWISHGHPVAVIAPPHIPTATTTVSIWLLLCAFSNGLTAMTGIEAVSNAVPLFRKPSITNARWTLTIVVGLLSLFMLFIGYLCPSYHIAAMNEDLPGYQNILSQLITAVVGRGIFYYLAIAAIFFVLTFSAQTSFADFPRVCRLLSEDGYLPLFFAERGRRLVYSAGIFILVFISGLLLVAFGGITEKLIPLFAIGAFTAFVLSQSGMVVYWIRQKDKKSYSKMTLNAIGAVTTCIALIIIIMTKFTQGAWIIVIVMPLLVMIFILIKKHYEKINKEITQPLKFGSDKLKSPIVIVPINGWNRVSEKAVRFGLQLSDDVIAIYISTQNDEPSLKTIWANEVEKPAKAAKDAIPRLEIIKSPYRRIYKPILDFVKKTKKENPGHLIAVVIPELVEMHWYDYLLHNIHAAGLKTLLMLDRDRRTIVISVPWYTNKN